MTALRRIIDPFPLIVLVVLCLTLGLAPFTPEPQLWEKLKMLMSGELVCVFDVFNLALHGAPWGLLILKLTLGRTSAD